jgi:6-phosphogluconolactonase (cycloisomerase 2 family)
MKRTRDRIVGFLVLALLPALAVAKLEAPDHVLYGNATLFGTPAAIGTVIEARSNPGEQVVARYVLGRDPRLGNQYALRLAMDTVNPRVAGRSRPGDPIRVYIGSRLAAETTVGAEGIAVRLDLDPQHLGTGPAVAVGDVEVLEGDAGTVAAVFPISMNTTSGDDVVLHWHTAAGTATGGAACGPGIDYIARAEVSATIPAGSLSGSLVVDVCGDTVVEPNETFTVQFDGVDGGVLERGFANATIIDDDDVPELLVADVRALEPGSGSTDMVFRPRLSRSSTVAASFQYSTQDLEAVAGLDYSARSGSVTIPAGELQAEIRIPVLADGEVEADERLRLVLTAPSAVRLARGEAFGTIVDPAYDPALEPLEPVVGGEDGIADLVQPSAIVVAGDGRHVYVASDALDSVLEFARTSSSGALAFVKRYSKDSSGFAPAKLDGARALVLSADGRHLYVAARDDGAVAVLGRDIETGALAFIENQADSALQGVRALRLSPDDQHLYAAGALANALVVFRRDPDTGTLTLLEAERNGVDDPLDAGGSVVAMDRPSGIAVSPDGAQVYIASRFGNAVNVFARDTAAGDGFGKLSFVTSYRNGLLGVQDIAGAIDLVLSPDGRQLYVAAEGSNAVVLFDRAADGSLGWRSRWRKGDAGVYGLGGAQAIAMAPNGREVFVTGFADDSFTVFRRLEQDEGTLSAGALVVRQTVLDAEDQVEHMKGPAALAASADNKHVYVAASIDNAILVFYRTSAVTVFGDGFE